MLDFEKQREELEARKQQFVRLQENPDFKVFLGTLQTQLIAQRAIFTRMQIKGIDDAFGAARHQGFIAGLEQAIATIEQHLTALEGDLGFIYQEIQNVSGTGIDADSE